MKHKQRAIETGYSCPHCDSEEVEAASAPLIIDSKIYLDMECIDCSNRWEEIYRLENIKEKEVE